MNVDDAIFLILDTNLLGLNICSYCKNNPIINVDVLGFWAEKYSGFSWKGKGFNVNVQLVFLSRSFCVSYANDIIRLKGQWYWWGKGYKKMSATRIAQELWFHALAYYVGSPIKKILNKLGVSWNWLNDIIIQAKYMEINNDDKREWIFVLAWSYASAIKKLVYQHLGGGYVYSNIVV